jgi:putative holliday junction resolvase
MIVLGIDYGSRRIGLAYGDEVGVATPLEAATEALPEARIEHIGAVIKKRRIEKLVVGFPYNMDGTTGFKAREVDAFIEELEKRFTLSVVRVDETLTSVQAENGLGRARRGVNDAKKQRASGNVDSSAAALILQDYLDTALGLPPADV